jgi:hypothetical protein
MTCQIAGCYRNGRTIPFPENLQGISREIQAVLQFGFKPFISFAAKHPAMLRHPALALFAADALAVIGDNLPDHRQFRDAAGTILTNGGARRVEHRISGAVAAAAEPDSLHALALRSARITQRGRIR